MIGNARDNARQADVLSRLRLLEQTVRQIPSRVGSVDRHSQGQLAAISDFAETPTANSIWSHDGSQWVKADPADVGTLRGVHLATDVTGQRATLIRRGYFKRTVTAGQTYYAGITAGSVATGPGLAQLPIYVGMPGNIAAVDIPLLPPYGRSVAKGISTVQSPTDAQVNLTIPRNSRVICDIHGWRDYDSGSPWSTWWRGQVIVDMADQDCEATVTQHAMSGSPSSSEGDASAISTGLTDATWTTLFGLMRPGTVDSGQVDLRATYSTGQLSIRQVPAGVWGSTVDHGLAISATW